MNTKEEVLKKFEELNCYKEMKFTWKRYQNKKLYNLNDRATILSIINLNCELHWNKAIFNIRNILNNQFIENNNRKLNNLRNAISRNNLEVSKDYKETRKAYMSVKKIQLKLCNLCNNFNDKWKNIVPDEFTYSDFLQDYQIIKDFKNEDFHGSYLIYYTLYNHLNDLICYYIARRHI